MKRFPAIILSALLIAAPTLAFAGGAADSLLRTTPPTNVTPIYNGPPLATGYVFDTTPSGNRVGILPVAPAVGDLLIAYCGTNNGVVAYPTPVSPWLLGESFTGGGGGLGNYIGGHSWVYWYATSTSTSVTPCTSPTSGGTGIWDIPAAAVSGVWATDLQAFVDASVNGGVPVSWSITAFNGHVNAIVLAEGNATCTAGPTIGSALTGDVTNGAANDSGAGSPVNIAWAGAAMGGTFNSTYTLGSGCGLRATLAVGSMVIN